MPTTMIRVAALAVLVSGIAFTGPLQAAPADTTEPTANVNIKDNSPQVMAQHVEDRIKTLHSKLGITSAQETKWNDVAQAMRDNETAITQQIQARQQNVETMSAIDDLQSYEKIAQVHVDGLQKLIPVFQALYNDMSDDQRKKADEVFGRFEGHRDDTTAVKSQ
jgi:hypothetical protein